MPVHPRFHGPFVALQAAAQGTHREASCVVQRLGQGRGIVPRENLRLTSSHAGLVSQAGFIGLRAKKPLKSIGFRREIV